MGEKIIKDLGINNYCFGCGEDNPIGAKLEFYKTTDKSLKSTFTIPRTWGGWGDIAHGGLQTVLLDEISGWSLISLLDKYALTINLQMEFYKPIYVGETIEATSNIEKIDGRDITVTSILKNDNGDKCTKGTFVFREVGREKIERLIKKNN
ncbi:MAG: PaaI family thioesterase [Candidatus Heimdallarchaeaceae archaeon]|jgi:acyl-coenzyme A thioesterase PaaI-like protein